MWDTELIYLGQNRTNGGLLWTRYWNFEFHKRRGIWLNERLLVSQEGLCSMDSVSQLSPLNNPRSCCIGPIYWSAQTGSYQWSAMYEGVSKSFRTESITKYRFTTINTRWEATQSVMAAKLTRLTHKMAIQLHLVAESYTICSSRSRRPVRNVWIHPRTFSRTWTRLPTARYGAHFTSYLQQLSYPFSY
jgi:hypothetical protein